MNKFYRQHVAIQWSVAIFLFVIGAVPLLVISVRAVENPLLYLTFLLFLPLWQFCFTPFFRLVGIYRYYSPMLLGYTPNDKLIDLHSGSSFDYLFVFALERGDKKHALKIRIMQYHLDGLLTIVRRIEEGEIPDSVEISATSYFFNERTAAKMGFSTEAPSLFYKMNLYVNFIDLFWMYSLSQGRFVIPQIWASTKIKTTGRSLVEHKDIVERYATMLATRA